MDSPVPIEPIVQALADAADSATRRSIVARAPAPWRRALTILAEGPEAAGAARRALALPAALREQPFPLALARLLHQGSYPVRLCAVAPASASVLADDEDNGAALDEPTLTAQLLAAMRAGDPDDAIGELRTREYLRLSRREVESAPLERVGSDLSALAGACVAAALQYAGIQDEVVVFGMGKLGGRELNFLSDIDLVFVHADALSGDDDDDGRGAVVALHTALRSVVRRLEGTGRWRPVFRVDLRLRPFGSRGPLSMSVTATEAYYERHGRPWERQAWLRGRAIAGNLAMGDEMRRRLRPFVYRRSMTESIFDEVAQLMARARRESRQAAGPHRGIDLKLDEGGIRTVEFAVQALQLMHAGKNPALRSHSTLNALNRLHAAGLVSDREHGELTDAYRFFRRVEHRVQLADGQQTHTIPVDDAARRLLAARLGIASDEGDDPLSAFDRRLAEHRTRVEAIAQTMAGGEHDPAATRVTTALDSGAPPAVRRDALQQLGLRDPDEAEALIAHLFARDEAAVNSAGAAGRGAERLLRACLDSADPDMALVRFARFSRDRPAHYGIWRFFAEPADLGYDLPRMTAELFGTSETLSAGLIGFPVGRGALPDDTIAVLEAAADHDLSNASTLTTAMRNAPVDPRGLDATLLRFKHRQLVRVGIVDLARRLDPVVIGRALSDLADRIVRSVIRDLVAESSWHAGPHFDLAVLAVGKYGAQAMDYGSDLDLMFVYEPSESTANGDGGSPSQLDAAPAATRFAQRLIARLSDRSLGMRLYEIDTRLRPSGRQGLLVSSRTAFARYHASALPVWEQLAMLRMRSIAEVTVGQRLQGPDLSGSDRAPTNATMAGAVAGPLCAGALAAVTAQLFGPTDSPVSRAAVGAAVGELKRRIERELARETRTVHNVKSGVGGCLELEVLVSALQLLHGGSSQDPQLRGRSIEAAIDALARAGALPNDGAGALSATYRFQRLLLNRLRMSHAGGLDDPDRFSENSPKLPTLARRMGLPDADALISRYYGSRKVVRRALINALPDTALPDVPDSN